MSATELIPTRTNLESDAAPLPTDEFVEARIEVFPFAHVVRAGSRLRFSVHTPGGDRARWTYILAEHPDDAVVDVGHNSSAPSSIALPEVTGITGYPASVPDDCNALAGPAVSHVRALRQHPRRLIEPATGRQSALLPGGSTAGDRPVDHRIRGAAGRPDPASLAALRAYSSVG